MENAISFIIPAYNCAQTITETIDSIFAGNFEEGDEVIVIEDCSTDNTPQIILALTEKYEHIRVLQHKINKGTAAAGRNTGIEQAKNELIFCLDADNVLVSNSIPHLKQYLLENKADAAAFGEIHYFKEKEKEKVKFKWILDPEITLYVGLNCIDRSPLSSGNYLFTKESWRRAGRYNESVGGAWDSWAFGFYQLSTGSKMITLASTHYYHRYGYESTYIKEIKKSNTSVTALQIILPYLHLLDECDVDYIMSKKGRYTWVENLNSRPIRLKASGAAGKDVELVYTRQALRKKPLYKRIARAIINEIKK